MSSVPFTRTLAYVLRQQTTPQPALRMIAGKVTAVPDHSRVTVDFGGGTPVTVPRLTSYQAAVNDSVWCLAGPSFVLAIGTVAPT